MSLFEDIEIVGYDNSILPELVNRAVNRIKPFTEGKQEFRDAVIWLSYALLAKERKLENCLLITGNTTDYCSKNKELHPDFLKDSERFTIYKDAYTLVEADNMKEFKEEYELTKLQINERHEAFLAPREEAKHWSNDEIINMLSIPDLSSTLKLAIEDYIFNHRLLNVREIIDIKFAQSWILSMDYIDHQYTMRGTLSVDVHVEENKNWGIRISRVLDDIHVVFQAIYSEEDKKINSIIVESTDSELDYDRAHISQNLH
ncbi:PIN domain-containing protein [Priestia megaterium]|uniref:PIN domain-containing protein n=1 Tax=Priestia megaterium TaxID=1404 RepID=UPI0015E45EEB|nr:PIN domain-containing protein [Priestia megaterium]